MMSGSKGILLLVCGVYDTNGLLRTRCFHNPENIRNPPLSGFFLIFCGFQGHDFSCKHEIHDFNPWYVVFMIPTDCYAQGAFTILKIFEIRPYRASFSYFAGSKVMIFHASMKFMTLTLGM
jgi:hypothetical protein